MNNELQRLRRTSRTARSALERRDQLVQEATEAGATRREVAEAAGLSVGAVQQILRRVGAIAVILVALMAPAAQAGKSNDLDDYIPGNAKLQAFYAAMDLGDEVLFGEADATTVFVDGRWTQDACKRVKLGVYLCPMDVYYRLEPGQHYREHCEAPVKVRRTGYRFPPAQATCPDEFLPPPTGIVWDDKTR